MDSTAQQYEKLKQLVQRIDPRNKLLRAWELKGGVSAQVTALEIMRPDGLPEKMVMRLHGAADFKKNLHIAADEFRLLQILHSTGIPAPKPYYIDESGELFPTPYIVLEYIEGETIFAPLDLADTLGQLATQLANIHHIDCSSLDFSFLPEQARIYAEKFRAWPQILDELLGESRIRDVLEKAWPFPHRNASVLLHGDYWPGNVLWKDGRIAAIIDWEDAQVGDPLADLAISRLEILWAFGREAMHSFTRQYESLSLANLSYTNLPYWDLCAALRPAFKLAEWAANPTVEKAMREHHSWFVTQAFDKLSAL